MTTKKKKSSSRRSKSSSKKVKKLGVEIVSGQNVKGGQATRPVGEYSVKIGYDWHNR